MKKPPLAFFILLLSLCFYQSSAQLNEVVKQVPCQDTMIMRQADSLIQRFQLDGFSIMMARPFSIPNGYELPIIFPLKKGGLYQMAFIGEKASRVYEVRLMDMEAHLAVKQRKMWGDVDGNIISFAYIPLATENYYTRYYQQQAGKKETLCGYFLLMKKTKASGIVVQEVANK